VLLKQKLNVFYHGHTARWNAAQGHSSRYILGDLHSTQDTCYQILVQIQQTAVQSQRALNISTQQISSKERERKILQLTIKEISTMGQDVHLYKGVGKMYGSH